MLGQRAQRSRGCSGSRSSSRATERGVRRTAGGKSPSSDRADSAAASATPAAASRAAGRDTLSNCVPSVGASASASHHDSPTAEQLADAPAALGRAPAGSYAG
jgi:hypothetical protein